MSLLLQFVSMRNESVGNITTVKHHVDPKVNSCPALQHPYRAGLMIRKRGAQETDRMLQEDVIKPAMSEWARSVVFSLKKDGKMRFYVSYKKLKAITVRGTCRLSRLEKCIDSLEDVTFF